MLEFSGSVGFGMHIGYFLKLQGAFHGYGIIHTPPQEEGALHAPVLFRQSLDLILLFQYLFHHGIHIEHIPNHAGQFSVVITLPDFTQVKSQQVHDHQLGRIGLGGSYSYFRPGMGVYDPVGFTGYRASHHISHRQDFNAVALGFPKCSQGIGSFSRLADDYH